MLQFEDVASTKRKMGKIGRIYFVQSAVVHK